jgi:hypothetical protein
MGYRIPTMFSEKANSRMAKAKTHSPVMKTVEWVSDRYK